MQMIRNIREAAVEANASYRQGLRAEGPRPLDRRR